MPEVQLCDVCLCPQVRVLTVPDITRVWRCSARTIHRLIRSGDLKATKMGRAWFINHEDWHAYLGRVTNYILPTREAC